MTGSAGQRQEAATSFQAYLDAVEDKTGRTPRQLLDEATEKGRTGPDVKAQAILEWLAADCGLGRGHAMAVVQVIKQGPRIAAKHVGTTGAHRDVSEMPRLDGKATRPR